MEVKYKMVPVEPSDEMLSNVDEIVGGSCYSCTPCRASSDDSRRVYAAMLEAAPKQLSGLEIVQKALSLEDLFVDDSKVGGFYDRYRRISDVDDLMAWAKQTIGEG